MYNIVGDLHFRSVAFNKTCDLNMPFGKMPFAKGDWKNSQSLQKCQKNISHRLFYSLRFAFEIWIGRLLVRYCSTKWGIFRNVKWDIS